MIATYIAIEEQTGCQVDDGVLIGAPCCCFAGNHRGHPYCEEPTEILLQAERDGLIVRSFDNGWHWIVTAR